jgi:CheY-like chemotaxis protein
MTEVINWQLLIVDDEEVICQQVKEFLEGETITDSDDRTQVETLTDFAKALDVLEAHRFDLLILDIRLGAYDETPEEEIGIETLKAIQRRRFIPVIFYTGLPKLIQEHKTALIQVVEKTEGLPRLLEVIRNIFATRLPVVNLALLRHLETVQRDYMWDFVAAHWEQFGDTTDRTALAYLLARRLALTLSRQGIQHLARELGDPNAPAIEEGKVHPMHYYIMPPVEPSPLTGDLYRGCIGGQMGYWVLLTPSCDLVTGREKAEWILLVRCDPLTEQQEYQGWKASLPQPSKTNTKKLEALLRNNRQIGQRERFYFLPGAFILPDLVVDFQQLVTLPQKQINGLDRLASLDSSFAGELLSRFIRYFGRPGTEDLDVEVIFSQFRHQADEEKE